MHPGFIETPMVDTAFRESENSNEMRQASSRIVSRKSRPSVSSSTGKVSVVEAAPGWFSHDLVVSDPSQMDDEFAAWLTRSYHLMGMKRRLRAPRTPRATRAQGAEERA